MRTLIAGAAAPLSSFPRLAPGRRCGWGWFSTAGARTPPSWPARCATASTGPRVRAPPRCSCRRSPCCATPRDTPAGPNPGDGAEDLTGGPTFALAAEAARANKVFVHASLYEKAPAADGLGYNTAILVSPSGDLVGRTRKMHIPISAGYYEDTYFRAGPAEDAYPVYAPEGLDARIGLPTCWDEWFPEVARNYSLGGAEIVVYPTAIGSEPVFPDLDTQPLWQQVIVANGINSGLFMVGAQPHRQRGRVVVLRFVVHLRSVRPGAGAGTARRGGGAGRRSGSGSAAGLAGALSLPADPAPGQLRRADRSGGYLASVRRGP